MVYVPAACGHGFLTVADDTEILYHIRCRNSMMRTRPMRRDDPVFQIAWREKLEVVPDGDRTYPDFELLSGPS